MASAPRQKTEGPLAPQHNFASVLGAVPPQQYNFENWDFFQSEAVRFHDLTWPDRRLVIDRIATFRSLMSPEVIEKLSSLVNLHPRYSTTEGWDEWLLAVTDALRSSDRTIMDAITAQNWVELFQTNKVSFRGLWCGLDRLACKHQITSTEQREMFWSAQSWERQSALLERSTYFDPHDPVWDNDEQSSERLLAEQMLNRIVVMSKEADSMGRTWIAVAILWLVSACLLAFAIGFLIWLLNKPKDNTFPIVGLVYSLLFMTIALVVAAVMMTRLSSLRRSQRESRSHELASA